MNQRAQFERTAGLLPLAFAAFMPLACSIGDEGRVQDQLLAGVQTIFLSDLEPVSSDSGWGPVERDSSNGETEAGDGGPIRLDGVTYARGLGMHSDARQVYDLGGRCTAFTAIVGIDDEVGDNGSVVFRVFVDGRQAFTSGDAPRTGRSSSLPVRVGVSGAQELALVVDAGVDGMEYDHADFADAKVECSPSPPAERTYYLSDLEPASSTNGWGPVERDSSNGESAAGDGNPITLAGTVYGKGLGMHAPAERIYDLGGACSAFTASIGVDDEVGDAGSVVFEVVVDGVTAYTSGSAPITGGGATATIDLDVTGGHELRLAVSPGADGVDFDHADWADAAISCADDGAPPAPPPTDPASDAHWILGYFGEGEPGYTAAQIPWDKYTHIVHFCAGADPRGAVAPLFLTDPAMRELIAARPPGKKVLLCVKENADGSDFAQATSPAHVDAFVASIVSTVDAYGYDGVDLDWERGLIPSQYTTLVTRLRAALGARRLITVAVGNWGGLPGFAAETHPFVDQFNAMCYDLYGVTENGVTYTYHNGALRDRPGTMSCEWALRGFTTAGVPRSKLGIGLPFYGQTWTGASNLLQPVSSSPSFTKYQSLVGNSLWQSANMRWDDVAMVEYLSVPATNQFVTYNGERAMREAARWMHSDGYGGVMTFAINHEYLAGQSGDARYPLSTALHGAVVTP